MLVPVIYCAVIAGTVTGSQSPEPHLKDTFTDNSHCNGTGCDFSDKGMIVYRNETKCKFENVTFFQMCSKTLQCIIENCYASEVKGFVQMCVDINGSFECQYTFLHVAVANGYYYNGTFIEFNNNCSLDFIKIFIDSGGNVNRKTDYKCNGSAPLHLAAQFGRRDAARLLLERNASIELKDRYFRTPLFVASEFGTTEVLGLLIDEKAFVNANENNRNWYPIHAATNNGHIQAMDMLLRAGANIEQESAWYERRPVHQAAVHDRTLALRYLLGKGADVNASDQWGRSSLHLAAELGHLEVAEILIRAEADVNSVMRARVTPLIAAANNGFLDMVVLLFESGADVKAETNDLRTALHYTQNIAVMKLLISLYPEAIHIKDQSGCTPLYYSTGYFDCFEELIRNGADPYTVSYNNETILHSVAQRGNINTTKAVLRFNIEIDAKDNEGQTALFRASKSGALDIFHYLLEKGADPNLKTNFNETLLHFTAKGGNDTILKAVLDVYKGSLDARNSEGRTAMYLAAVNGRYSAYELLFNSGADPSIADSNGDTLLHWAAHYGSQETVKKILDRAIDIEVTDRMGRTPLYVAAERGSRIAFSLLVAKGANMSVTTKEGNTLIHGAAIGGNLEISRYVLLKTKNINAQDNSGRTALYIAASKSNEKLFNYFIENRSDVKIKTFDKRTILHAAAAGGSVYIVGKILKITNYINYQDASGKSAIFYAIERKKISVVFLLLRHGADPSPTSNGWTLLHSACKNRGRTRSVVDMARISLNLSGNVNAQDHLGKTPLFVCSESYQSRIFTYLLEERNADPDVPTIDGTTILHTSSHYGDDLTAAKVLRRSERSVHMQDSGGRSPLHWAVYSNRVAIAERLLRHNADAHLETVYGYTPLMIAAAMGSEEMMKTFQHVEYNGEAMLGMALAWNNRNVIPYLLRSRIKPKKETKIHFAAARGDNKELQELLKNDRPKSIRFSDIMSEITKEYQQYTIAMEEEEIYIVNPLNFNLSPLDMAVFFNGSLETVQLILNMNNGSYVDLVKNRKRWTPLDMAAYSGKEEMVVFFLKMRSNKEFLGDDSWSAMHKAAWGGRSSVIELLHRNDFGDIDAGDALGRTPLHTAALRGFNKTVERILSLSNASLNRFDRYHFTPLHLAEIYGHQKFFEQLATMTITMDPKIRYKIHDPGHVAAKRNHTRTVELLLDKGADPNSADRVFGWTPLHWAAAIGDLRVARMLVASGARVNLPSKLGQTPMFLARFWGRQGLYGFFKENNGVW